MDIELKTTANEIIKIPLDEVYISTENNFFITDKNIKKILVSNYNDEKIIFKFANLLKNIDELKIKINFTKANITNKPNC